MVCGTVQRIRTAWHHRRFGAKKHGKIRAKHCTKSNPTVSARHLVPAPLLCRSRTMQPIRAVLKGGKKEKIKVFQNCSFAKRPRLAHMFNHGWWRLAVGGWRLVAIGSWWLAVGGGWRLAVGGP